MENLIGKTVYVPFRNTQGEIIDYDDEFVTVDYPSLGFSEKVNYKMESVMIDDNDTMEHGGSVENKEMLMNQSYEVTHHAKELSEVIKKTKRVEPWVVAKLERATTDLSDITHYLDGQSKMEHGGTIEVGDKVRATKEYGGKSGVVIEKRGSFVVVEDSKGKTESYHESDLVKKMEHGGSMYADGGNISSENQEKIVKLEKVLSSNLVPESAKEKARLEIERLKSESITIESEKDENPTEKIKLKYVEILWAEGDTKKYDKFPKKYTSWKSANEAVKPISKDASKHEAYNKVGFVITFEDDEQYTGRLDVASKVDNPNVEPYIGNVFGVHVKEWLDYLLSDESGESESQKQEVREWLAKYDLGLDAKKEEEIEAKEDEKPAVVVKDDRLKGKHISEASKYVPHRNIESITFTIDGKQHTVKGSDIFDGIYVENSVLGIKAKRTSKKQPKVARTQFEDETFEFAKGGKIESVAVVRDRVESFLSPYGYSARVEDAGNSEIHIEPSTTKVGDKRKDFFDGMQIHRFADGMYEVSEYQAGPNQDELYIYKETKSLPLALKDLIKGNNRKPIKKW